ncbi:glycoside hydrolase family protein [Sulfurimonas sp. HSL1-6]|uniref:glycoside hydrolase family protein n=1 Tax=Thiomicrolovo immobilis TaxID=3131935 RepID=UPI0031F981C1
MWKENLIEQLKEHEGFRGDPYNDHLGFPTIGYGCKLPLSKEEATVVLKMRLETKISQLESAGDVFETLPEAAKEIIANMAYQMGVGGVMKFKDMWAALGRGDFPSAAAAGRDSRWYRQTPSRAEELMSRLEVL